MLASLRSKVRIHLLVLTPDCARSSLVRGYYRLPLRGNQNAPFGRNEFYKATFLSALHRSVVDFLPASMSFRLHDMHLAPRPFRCPKQPVNVHLPLLHFLVPGVITNVFRLTIRPDDD